MSSRATSPLTTRRSRSFIGRLHYFEGILASHRHRARQELHLAAAAGPGAAGLPPVPAPGLAGAPEVRPWSNAAARRILWKYIQSMATVNPTSRTITKR